MNRSYAACNASHEAGPRVGDGPAPTIDTCKDCLKPEQACECEPPVYVGVLERFGKGGFGSSR